MEQNAEDKQVHKLLDIEGRLALYEKDLLLYTNNA